MEYLALVLILISIISAVLSFSEVAAYKWFSNIWTATGIFIMAMLMLFLAG